MRITVTVKPRAKAPGITKIDDAHYALSVREPPAENKANFAALDALAGYFKVPVRRIRLVRGRASREKVFEII